MRLKLRERRVTVLTHSSPQEQRRGEGGGIVDRLHGQHRPCLLRLCSHPTSMVLYHLGMATQLLSWNVNGLRAVHRRGQFMALLEEASPDILCLQETKSRPDQLAKELLEVPGYSVHFSSAERAGYSGVGVYSRVAPQNVSRTFGPDDRWDGEGRVLALDYGEFILYNVYFPNGRSSKQRLAYKMEFYQAFLEHIDAERKSGRNVIVCGDVNTAYAEIDLARPAENKKTSGFLPEEREWMDRLFEHGFVDTFRRFVPDENGHYSYWDTMTRARERNVGWRIDYFFVNSEMMDSVSNAFIRADVMGSDHCPVGLELSSNL